jgi:hypothetical protein
MDEDRKSLLERMMEATQDTVSKVQREVSQSSMASATKERATAVRTRTQAAAVSGLQLATRDDVVRLQASLDRVEAALADIAGRIPEKPKPRAAKPKPPDAPAE